MTWLGFAAPAWVAGLAAVALPVAIHLLSRGRQSRILVGSVRWLAPAETLRARRMRVSRWWLLALRCLLIATLAMALAEPRIEVAAGGETRSWLLVEPEVAASRARLETDNQAAFDALDKALLAGAQLRWLVPGMPAGDLEAPPPDSGLGLWSLLHEADHAAPAGAKFVVVASGRSVALDGERAAMERRVEWHGVIDLAPNRWLERAVVQGNDELAVVVGTSDGAGTRFERLVVDASAPQSPGFVLEDDNTVWRLTLASGGSVAADDTVRVPRTPEPLRAAILFSAERTQDARYLVAGLEAVGEASSRPISVRQQQVEDAAPTLGEAREPLIFWLSASPVPRDLLARVTAGTVLVSDALERFERCTAELWLPAANEALQVDRCGPVDGGGLAGEGEGLAAAVWSAADGRPLLVGERLQAGLWWRFASRWNPDWTDLVLAPQFPAWLLGLVEQAGPTAASSRSAESDRRSAAEQAAPRQAVASAGRSSGRELPIASWSWLLVFALAAGERRLALGRAA